MKNILLTALLTTVSSFLFAQNIDGIINAKEVERIERVLASDDMQGRKVFTPGIDKAADFIALEFAKSKLKFIGDSKSYFQEFKMIKAKPLSVSGKLDGEILSESNVTANATAKDINITSLKDFEIITLKKGEDFSKIIFSALDKTTNVIVLVDTSHSRRYKNLQRFTSGAKFSSPLIQLFVLTTNANPTSFELNIKNELTEQSLKNVIGVLPGKSKKDEYVVFSAHYDHIGIGKPDKNMDSIFNGANDDAAGTTGVIMLSKYFSQLKNNERSIIFVAFTAEESGGFGSQYFSKNVDPSKVMAMFNIEMIGTESKWGKNSAYITGFEKTDMGKILEKNLAGTGFTFHPDPYPDQQLFYRSDNATLAKLGVPAHTISTSKMDSEPNYHKASDHVETLDLENMTLIIKSIALSARSIISGKDTPTRVDSADLR